MATQSKTQKIAALQADIAALRTDKHARHDALTASAEREITERIKALNSDLAALITEGAEPCEHCGGHPHGIVQAVPVKGVAMPYFEVGCLVCPDHRAQGFAPEQAVEQWNAENYLTKKVS